MPPLPRLGIPSNVHAPSQGAALLENAKFAADAASFSPTEVFVLTICSQCNVSHVHSGLIKIDCREAGS